MPPLNWDRLQSLELEKLDENEAETWYQDLLSVILQKFKGNTPLIKTSTTLKVKVEKETDVERLQSLFKLSRTIMEVCRDCCEISVTFFNGPEWLSFLKLKFLLILA